ncbi:hypothetical protein DZF79_05255 [Vibrio parahaemolyticus]|nr:hypothetical protein [Vibrio parahaemolyticus]
MYSVFYANKEEKENSPEKMLKTMDQRIEDEGNQYYDPPPLDEDYNEKYPRYRGKGITKPKPTRTELRKKAKRKKVARRKNRV